MIRKRRVFVRIEASLVPARQKTRKRSLVISRWWRPPLPRRKAMKTWVCFGSHVRLSICLFGSSR